MGGQDYRIFPMLDHARHQTRREGLRRRVEVADHGIAAPPTHDSDCVGVNYCQDQCYGAYCSHRVCTDLGWFETNLWAGDLDGLLEHLGDICDSGSRSFPVYGYFHQ